MTSKYDKLLPQLLEDLKTMSMADVERKHGLRLRFLTNMITVWKNRGMIDANYVPPVKYKTKVVSVTKAIVQSDIPKSPDPPKQPVRLPPFDNSWPTELKIEWMKAYIVVVGRAKTIPFKEEEKH